MTCQETSFTRRAVEMFIRLYLHESKCLDRNILVGELEIVIYLVVKKFFLVHAWIAITLDEELLKLSFVKHWFLISS
jgi:hypothetical protein